MKPDPATLCLLCAIAFVACVLAGGLAIHRPHGPGFAASWLGALASLVGMIHYGSRAE
jgi:hypothetical protein